jgi:hypothetical protein
MRLPHRQKEVPLKVWKRKCRRTELVADAVAVEVELGPRQMLVPTTFVSRDRA